MEYVLNEEELLFKILKRKKKFNDFQNSKWLGLNLFSEKRSEHS